jgi:allantoicase
MNFYHRGMPVGFSNAHYGQPLNMISPGNSEGMYDGWETGT